MTKQQFDIICDILMETMRNYNFNIVRRNMNLATLYQGKFFGIYDTLTTLNVCFEYDFDENGFHALEIDDSINKFYVEL